MNEEINKLVKSKIIKEADRPNILGAVIKRVQGDTPTTALPKSVNDLVERLTELTKEQLGRRTELGLPKLEQKVFPNVPATESKEFLSEAKNVVSKAREFGGTDPSTLQASYFKLDNAIVKAEGGIAKELDGGREFLQVGGAYFEKPTTVSSGARQVIQKANEVASEITNPQ